MASIDLVNVSVDYPIYSARGRSLKTILLSTVGGKIGVDRSAGVVVEALRDINLSIVAGDRIAILGGNGAGKSTLLRVLAGIMEPPIGSTCINGRVSALLDLSMGMDMDATGYDNILMRSTFLGASFRQAKELVPKIADFSELGEFLAFPVRTYSSGMVVRLAFAISTSVVLDILVLDEHVGAADASFTEKAKQRMRELADQAKIVIFATHDFNAASSLCSRGVVLSNGHIAYDGSVDNALGFYERLTLGLFRDGERPADI